MKGTIIDRISSEFRISNAAWGRARESAGTKFSGEVNWVEIDIGKDAVSLDHLITPEDPLRVAMARQ